MKTTTGCALGLSFLMLALAGVPASADSGGGGSSDHGGGGGGDAHGTPAPIAGLGLLALGAIRYGSRKLRKHNSE